MRKRIASEFVRVLREEDGEHVLRYGEAFFRPLDLEFVPEQHKAMVREHLLGRVSSIHTLNTLSLIDGIGAYLQPTDVMKWLDPFIRTLVSTVAKDGVKQRARSHLFEDATLTSGKVDSAIDRRLDEWIRHYENGDAPERAEFVRTLKKELVAQRIPF